MNDIGLSKVCDLEVYVDRIEIENAESFQSRKQVSNFI